MYIQTLTSEGCVDCEAFDAHYVAEIDPCLDFVCRMLGFTTAGAVVVEDACLWLLLEGGVLSSMGPTLLLVTISRAGLVGLGQK